MAVRAVLFDLDGTLIDSAQGIAIALNELRTEHGFGPLPLAEVRLLVALGVEALIAKGLEATTCEPADLARFRYLLGTLHGDPTMIYPGVVEMLDELSGWGCILAVVTNKPEHLSRRLLDQLCLLDKFKAIVGGDTAVRPKPDPAPISYALASIGIPAQSSIYVGDSGVDAAAARACGIPFLLFRGGYGALDCASQDVSAHFDFHKQLPDMIRSSYFWSRPAHPGDSPGF